MRVAGYSSVRIETTYVCKELTLNDGSNKLVNRIMPQCGVKQFLALFSNFLPPLFFHVSGSHLGIYVYALLSIDAYKRQRYVLSAMCTCSLFLFVIIITSLVVISKGW